MASVFVVNGIKAIRDPESLVPAAEPFTDKVVPLAKKYAPAQVATTIPDDTITLVRLGGALQTSGGLALATGKGRRAGAAMLALALVPQLLASNPLRRGLTSEEKQQSRSTLLRDLGLLGGVLIAAQDTEGRPSLAWRAHAGGERIADKSRKMQRQISKDARKAAKDAKKQALKARKAITS